MCSQAIAKADAKKGAAKPVKEDAAIADAALIGIGVKKEVDFPSWYQQVLTKGDMLDYYDVSGCYILKVRSPSAVKLRRLIKGWTFLTI